MLGLSNFLLSFHLGTALRPDSAQSWSSCRTSSDPRGLAKVPIWQSSKDGCSANDIWLVARIAPQPRHTRCGGHSSTREPHNARYPLSLTLVYHSRRLLCSRIWRRRVRGLQLTRVRSGLSILGGHGLCRYHVHHLGCDARENGDDWTK